MIDSIRFYIDGMVSEANLHNPKIQSDDDAEVKSITYTLGNLKVTYNNYTDMTAIQGSLRTYLFGKCSLNDLSHVTLGRAIEKLRTELLVDEDRMKKAKVTRLDLGFNLVVRYPVSVIINSIGSKTKLNKVIYHNSVSFQGANKKLIFYDKIAEIKKHQKCRDIDIDLQNLVYNKEHVMRVELQLLKLSGLEKQLPGIKSLNSLFKDGNLTKKLTDYFMNELESVKFINPIEIDTTQQITNKSHALSLVLLKELGYEKALGILKDWAKKGYIKSTLVSAVRREFNEYQDQLKTGEDYKAIVMDKALLVTDDDEYTRNFRYKLDKILFGE